MMEEDKAEDMMELNGVQTEYYEKFPVKVATKDSTE